jgi:hypothetical protein
MHNKNCFFHGTGALSAVCIAVDGFRLLDERLRPFGPGCIGGGIYLTAAPKNAAWFAGGEGCVLRVRLAPGTRILRLDGRFDQRIIDSLRREFGADVLSADFDRAIPRNKKLTRAELINLFNYLWGKTLLGNFSDEHRQVRRYLTRNKYHGMGHETSDVGIVIFNPSRLVLEGVMCLRSRTQSLSEAEPHQLLVQASRELLNQVRWARLRLRSLSEFEPADDWDTEAVESLNALRQDLPRRQDCLRHFAEKNGLPTHGGDLQAALEAELPEC